MKFSLSNEGYIHLYPLEPFKDRLEKAVKSREISFQVPAKDAVNKTTAVNMSAIKTFDSLCRTTTPSEASTTYSTPSQKITTYFTSSQKGTTYSTASPNRGTTYLTESQKKGTTHFTASPKGTTYFTRNRQSAWPEETSSSTTGETSGSRICTFKFLKKLLSADIYFEPKLLGLYEVLLVQGYFS